MQDVLGNNLLFPSILYCAQGGIMLYEMRKSGQKNVWVNQDQKTWYEDEGWTWTGEVK